MGYRNNSCNLRYYEYFVPDRIFQVIYIKKVTCLRIPRKWYSHSDKIHDPMLPLGSVSCQERELVEYKINLSIYYVFVYYSLYSRYFFDLVLFPDVCLTSPSCVR